MNFIVYLETFTDRILLCNVAAMILSMAEVGEETWKAHTTPFDRVQSVVLSVNEPRSVEWIAEEAAVSVGTTETHLESLVEIAVVLEHNAGDQPLYSPDPLYTQFQTIRSLLNVHDRDGLIEIRNELQTRIDAWQNEYGVDSPEALRSHGDAADSPQDTDHPHGTVNEWELVEHRLNLVNAAITRYDTYNRP
jgi:hypothetical protein